MLQPPTLKIHSDNFSHLTVFGDVPSVWNRGLSQPDCHMSGCNNVLHAASTNNMATVSEFSVVMNSYVNGIRAKERKKERGMCDS